MKCLLSLTSGTLFEYHVKLGEVPATVIVKTTLVPAQTTGLVPVNPTTLNRFVVIVRRPTLVCGAPHTGVINATQFVPAAAPLFRGTLVIVNVVRPFVPYTPVVLTIKLAAATLFKYHETEEIGVTALVTSVKVALTPSQTV